MQLQQVLLNLVINGMDAMNTVEESKRVLMICGHRETRDGRLETLVSVQDAGTGFKPEEVGRLFEAFYTTKPQGIDVYKRQTINTMGSTSFMILNCRRTAD